MKSYDQYCGEKLFEISKYRYESVVFWLDEIGDALVFMKRFDDAFKL